MRLIAFIMIACLVGCSASGKERKSAQKHIATAEIAEPVVVPAERHVTPAKTASTPTDFVTSPKYAFDKKNVETLCTEAWTKRGELDKRMFDYCVRQNVEGHAQLLVTLKKFETHPWLQDVFPAIWDSWTKRGVSDYNQIAYVLNHECDKFLDYMYETKQPNFNSAKMAACKTEPGVENDNLWSQTMYCYKRD